MVTAPQPYNQNLAIVPDDTVNLLPFKTQLLLTWAIYVGVTGDVVTVAQDDSLVTWKAVPAGTFLPVAVKRVNGSGTSATNLVACYWV